MLSVLGLVFSNHLKSVHLNLICWYNRERKEKKNVPKKVCSEAKSKLEIWDFRIGKENEEFYKVYNKFVW